MKREENKVGKDSDRDCSGSSTRPDLNGQDRDIRCTPNFGSAEMQKLFQSFLNSVGASQPTLGSHANEDQVKVGEALTLSRSNFIEAKLARTPSSMTMDLVRVTFSSRRLRKSSYAGQSRTRNGVKVCKPALKKYKRMKDIQNFVLQRFPYFTQSAFSHAVNACLGNNVDRRPVRELVDQSASEESDL